MIKDFPCQGASLPAGGLIFNELEMNALDLIDDKLEA
jgi:hypothetical protein